MFPLKNISDFKKEKTLLCQDQFCHPKKTTKKNNSNSYLHCINGMTLSREHLVLPCIFMKSLKKGEHMWMKEIFDFDLIFFFFF